MHLKMFKTNLIVAILLCVTLSVTTLSAEDWPHWMGLQRNNHWNESGLLERFPEGGPKVDWETEIASGYSGPAVSHGHVYITDYVTAENVRVPNFERNQFSGMERVHCLNEADGKLIWQHDYPVKYSVSYPSGPRCTPIVDGGRVYTLGTEGHLFCFDAESGNVLWSHHLPEKYHTKTPLWGYAAHPLIDGDQLITLAGGAGSHVVAFDKATGEEKWKALTSNEQGYSPPTIITAGGQRQLILLRPDAVTSVNPKNGKEYWSVPYEASNGSIIMSPIKVGDYLYVAGYSQKSLLLKLDAEQPGASEVWRDKTHAAISPVNVQPIAVDNVVYGVDQSGYLIALEIPSGNQLWKTPEPISKERPAGSGTAFIVQQASRFWMFTENGELVIANLSPKGYEELDRVKVIEPTNTAFNRDVVWSMPAFANRCAFIRNDKKIIAVNLSEGAK
jgi:outer membrane protein assembly factor BamB